MATYMDPSAEYRYGGLRQRSPDGQGGPQYGSSMFDSPISSTFPSHPARNAPFPHRDDGNHAGPSRSPVTSTAGALASVSEQSPGGSSDHLEPRRSRSPLISMRARDFALEENAEQADNAHNAAGSRDPFGDATYLRSTQTVEQLRGNGFAGTDDGFSFMDHDDFSAFESPSKRNRPLPPHREMTDPLHLPPASAHDAYVSRFLLSADLAQQSQTNPSSPLDNPGSNPFVNPGNGPRGSLVRSSSAPGVQLSTSSRGLLPSPLQDQPILDEPADGTPIFEVFNAQLSKGAVGMVKVLKTHLEDVLRMQEEVGRMHLALEGLGPSEISHGAPSSRKVRPEGSRERKAAERSPGKESADKEDMSDTDRLREREHGVEDIMDKLSALSTTLRTYHSYGTPKLVFPATGHMPARKARTQSIDPITNIAERSGRGVAADERRTAAPSAQRTQSRRLDLDEKLSKLALDLDSPPRGRSERDNVVVDSPRRLSFDGERSAEGNRDGNTRQGSDLAPLSLSSVPSPQGSHIFTAHAHEPERPERPKDQENLARQASMRNMKRALGVQR